jgi:hypothetical protein
MLGAQRRVERRASGDLLIFPARRRLLGYALLGLVLTAGGVWMLGWAEPTTFIDSRAMIQASGAFVTLVFGAGTIFLIGRSSSRRPLVIINNEGILNRETVWDLPLIRWNEITGVWIDDELGHRRLRFDLRDPESVIRRCRSPLSRRFHTRILQSGRSILVVSEDHSAIPLAELKTEIDARLHP